LKQKNKNVCEKIKAKVCVTCLIMTDTSCHLLEEGRNFKKIKIKIARKQWCVTCLIMTHMHDVPFVGERQEIQKKNKNVSEKITLKVCVYECETTHMRIHIYIHTYIYICIYINLFMYMNIYMCVCLIMTHMHDLSFVGEKNKIGGKRKKGVCLIMTHMHDLSFVGEREEIRKVRITILFSENKIVS